MSCHEIESFTDTAPSIGFGGYWKDEYFASPWPNFVPKGMSTPYYELLPLVVAASLWGKMWRGRKIMFRSDNETVVAVIQNGRCKDRTIMSLMRRFTLYACEYHFVPYAQHIPGVEYEAADCLSRLKLGKFRMLKPDARACSLPIPPPQNIFFPYQTYLITYYIMHMLKILLCHTNQDFISF
ncbi:unnamed protein product [Didymodactylos carnosus]|uniref:Uncharacterized protein n=1 Tax=Didymodactylos carnosus TaxID=1234261 RepID=A0A8S2E919_9BILA|nr:unnamed protein product [Didymodactylos carnosus]CAF3847399.1 unnamed protein product [Didymodactylos carnosus]